DQVVEGIEHGDVQRQLSIPTATRRPPPGADLEVRARLERDEGAFDRGEETSLGAAHEPDAYQAARQLGKIFLCIAHVCRPAAAQRHRFLELRAFGEVARVDAPAPIAGAAWAASPVGVIARYEERAQLDYLADGDTQT